MAYTLWKSNIDSNRYWLLSSVVRKLLFLNSTRLDLRGSPWNHPTGDGKMKRRGVTRDPRSQVHPSKRLLYYLENHLTYLRQKVLFWKTFWTSTRVRCNGNSCYKISTFFFPKSTNISKTLDNSLDNQWQF